MKLWKMTVLVKNYLVGILNLIVDAQGEALSYVVCIYV